MKTPVPLSSGVSALSDANNTTRASATLVQHIQVELTFADITPKVVDALFHSTFH